jgi:hypothetical protein
MGKKQPFTENKSEGLFFCVLKLKNKILIKFYAASYSLLDRFKKHPSI